MFRTKPREEFSGIASDKKRGKKEKKGDQEREREGKGEQGKKEEQRVCDPDACTNSLRAIVVHRRRT